MNKEKTNPPENSLENDMQNLEFVLLCGANVKEFKHLQLAPEIRLYKINEADDEEVCVHEATWVFSAKGDLLEEELVVARKTGDQTRIS